MRDKAWWVKSVRTPCLEHVNVGWACKILTNANISLSFPRT